jgi:hypothetical protein
MKNTAQFHPAHSENKVQGSSGHPGLSSHLSCQQKVREQMVESESGEHAREIRLSCRWNGSLELAENSTGKNDRKGLSHWKPNPRDRENGEDKDSHQMAVLGSRGVIGSGLRKPSAGSVTGELSITRKAHKRRHSTTLGQWLRQAGLAEGDWRSREAPTFSQHPAEPVALHVGRN